MVLLNHTTFERERDRKREILTLLIKGVECKVPYLSKQKMRLSNKKKDICIELKKKKKKKRKKKRFIEGNRATISTLFTYVLRC